MMWMEGEGEKKREEKVHSLHRHRFQRDEVRSLAYETSISLMNST